MHRLLKMEIIVALALMLSQNCGAITNDEFCDVVYDTSKTIMEVRQLGRPMGELIKKAKGNAAEDMLRSIIITAYDSPKYELKQLKEKSINDFSNTWYLECIKRMDKK